MNASIETIVAGGWGLARTVEGVLFARAVLPGEEIRVTTSSRRRGVLWAESYELLTPSPDRVESSCPFFPLCGGCDFHHMSRHVELEAKLGIASDTFRRITGRTIEVELAAPDEVNPVTEYRNSIRIQGGGGYLGYCRKASHEIVDIDDCLIARPEIRAELRRRRETLSRLSVKNLTIRSGFDPATRAPAFTVLSTSHHRTQIEGESLLMKLEDRFFEVDARSFFQVNTTVMEAIIRDLREFLPAGPRLLDLFAGVGAIALSLRERYGQVVGCEISRSAVGDFRRNACGAGNVTILEWNAAQGLKTPLEDDDVVIVDPPRTGLPSRLRADLATRRPAALAYVSCDVATFARDLKDLLERGYTLAGAVRIHDMFPRTAHMELLGILIPN